MVKSVGEADHVVVGGAVVFNQAELGAFEVDSVFGHGVTHAWVGLRIYGIPELVDLLVAVVDQVAVEESLPFPRLFHDEDRIVVPFGWTVNETRDVVHDGDVVVVHKELAFAADGADRGQSVWWAIAGEGDPSGCVRGHDPPFVF